MRLFKQQSGYDPKQDPRYLGATEEDDEEERLEDEEIARELHDLILVSQMYETEGWRVLSKQLTEELLSAERTLIDGSLKDTFAEQELRGRAKFLRSFLERPESIHFDIRSKQDQLSPESPGTSEEGA